MRTSIRRAALIVACVSIAWTLWLFFFGGFDRTVFGVRIRSNNPQRLVFLAALALAVYVVNGGRIPLARVAAASRSGGQTLAGHPAWIAGVLAACATIVAGVNSTRIAGGADVYGYVSQAELWLNRDLKVEQSWTAGMPFPNTEWIFAPLGYRPVEGEAAIVPTYSPGLPMLLAAAKSIGGQCAMFAVVPLAFGIAVLATYGLGCRLGSAAAGVIAGWFIATSPVALEVAVEPLTDVPVMTAWSLAFYFVLGATTWRASAGGLCAALAILIRPNLVPLVVPLALWLLVRRDGGPARDRLTQLGAFALCALPGIAAVALINDRLYGSAGASGYGSLADGFALAHVTPNLRRFVEWIVTTQTPLALVAVAALAIPLRRIWPGVRDRRVFAVIVLFIALLLAQYSAYLEFDSAGYLRFLLPAWPFLTLALASVLLAFARARGVVSRALTAVAVVALGVWTFQVAVHRDVFEQRHAARHAAPLGRTLRAHTSSNSVMLALHRSGSVRYYAGRITARYDMLDPEWLDRFVAWMTERGVHVYAVLDAREAAEAKGRFAGQQLASAFDRPTLVYQPAGVAVYDLSRPPAASANPSVITEDPTGDAACDPPTPGPEPLVLMRVRVVSASGGTEDGGSATPDEQGRRHQ